MRIQDIQSDQTLSKSIFIPNNTRFRPYLVNKLIHQILQERLQGATYHPDTCSQWGREISDEIKIKLKELNLPRYKYVVNVIIGEKRGEGVRIGARSFYDADTDSMAQSTFMNVSLKHLKNRNPFFVSQSVGFF